MISIWLARKIDDNVPRVLGHLKFVHRRSIPALHWSFYQCNKRQVPYRTTRYLISDKGFWLEKIYTLILFTSLWIELHATYHLQTRAPACVVSHCALNAMVGWQNFNACRATRSPFRSVNSCTSSSSSFFVAIIDLCNGSIVHPWVLFSCCITIRHIAAAICLLMGPGYSQAIWNNHVRWLLDFEVKIVINHTSFKLLMRR